MSQIPTYFYPYPHPHPAVNSDVVLFTLRNESLCLLLIQRANPPFLN